MRQIIWNETYSVGVKALDVQHQEIFASLNKMFEIIGSSSKFDQLDALIGKLEKYSSEHFYAEELLFTKYKFIGTEGHKKEHQIYIEKIAGFKNRMNTQDVQVIEDILGFLADWWMGHIQGCDKEYTRFLNNNGVF